MGKQYYTFRYDLQGLRAIAILLVIFAHANLGILQGGFIGVDVFFVLSGYLITGLLLREIEQNGRIYFMPFYAKRLKRLLPALIVMLTVSSGIAIVLLSGVEARAQLASSVFAATWTSNIYFAFSAIDYFNELANRDIFLHTWSLGVEEQFYLIWPVIVALLWRAIQYKKSHNTHRLMSLSFSLIFMLSLVLSLYWTINLPEAAFYLMPSRIWQFSLGAKIFLVFRKTSVNDAKPILNGDKLQHITLGIGLLLIIGGAIIISPDFVYPGLWILIPSFGTAFVIAAGHVLSHNKNSLLAHPVLVWLGNRSYSLYLWHWPIFIIGFSLGFQGQVLPILGMMLLSMLAAMLSYRFVELPFWKGHRSHTEPKRIILMSLFTMTIVIFTLYQGLNRLPLQGTPTDISNQWRMDYPELYRMKCDAWYAHAQVKPCVFGESNAQKTIVFLGDSIGTQWFSMIPAIFPAPLWRIVVLTKSSCAMVDEDYYYPQIKKIYQVCTDWRNAVLDELNTLKPDILIMGSASTYDFSEQQWLEGSARIFARVSQAAANVFVIPGTPNLGFDGPGCVSRHLTSKQSPAHQACSVKDRLKYVEPITRLLSRVAEHFSNVRILNLNDLVCPEKICSAINKEGIVVFRDSQHLTDSFVRTQIPLIKEKFKRLYQIM